MVIYNRVTVREFRENREYMLKRTVFPVNYHVTQCAMKMMKMVRSQIECNVIGDR